VVRAPGLTAYLSDAQGDALGEAAEGDGLLLDAVPDALGEVSVVVPVVGAADPVGLAEPEPAGCGDDVAPGEVLACSLPSGAVSGDASELGVGLAVGPAEPLGEADGSAADEVLLRGEVLAVAVSRAVWSAPTPRRETISPSNCAS